MGHIVNAHFLPIRWKRKTRVEISVGQNFNKGLILSFNTIHLFGEKNMLRSQFVKTPIEGLSSNFNTFHLLFGEKSFQFIKTPIAKPAQLFWRLQANLKMSFFFF